MYILIDNDKLIQASWKIKAKKNNIELTCFNSVSEFLSNACLFSKLSFIYIDSDLGPNCRGEILSKEIYDLGFNHIYMCTGFNDIDLNNYPWLKGVIQKSPPF